MSSPTTTHQKTFLSRITLKSLHQDISNSHSNTSLTLKKVHLVTIIMTWQSLCSIVIESVAICYWCVDVVLILLKAASPWQAAHRQTISHHPPPILYCSEAQPWPQPLVLRHCPRLVTGGRRQPQPCTNLYLSSLHSYILNKLCIIIHPTLSTHQRVPAVSSYSDKLNFLLHI